ncbi:MAG: hypothetical protein L0241_32285 [Planctomycetia bacterium]|nr:hypothetical protein [Planctomycetia bacterium]
MEWVCGLVVGVVIFATFGHLLWVAGAAIFKGIFGTVERPVSVPTRTFRFCPACDAELDDRDMQCPHCDLYLYSRLARDLHCIRVAQREVRALLDHAQIDRETAEDVLNQLNARARSLQGLPAIKPVKRPIAAPVAPAPVVPAPVAPEPVALAPVELLPEPRVEPTEPLPVADLEKPATPARVPEPLPKPAAPVVPASSEPPPLFSPALATALSVSEAPSVPPTPARQLIPVSPPVLPPPPPPHTPTPPLLPRRKLATFLEEHNIFWGELVGGLLIVGCSIALIVTLWRQLEEIRYFPFGLSFLITLGLFGAGQYTLHRWKLANTSRGMLVISMLLTPLTMLLLSDPVAHGRGDALDIGIKLAALVAFIGIVRTAGRDLIGTEHLPGPIDRRWLLSLAVVGAAGSQLLPAAAVSAWVPLACFIVACGATLGGLSWYHPGKREDPISEKSGSALLMFIGLSAFALFAAWGLYIVREPTELIARLHGLAIPVALVGVPVVEAGILVFRRVANAPGLRTAGTGVALTGFALMTGGLALSWPDPISVLVVSAAGGLFLTRISFRERLAWVQFGAIPLLAFAAVLGFHGIVGNWIEPAEVGAEDWLRTQLASAESGAVLVGFALVLALLSELLARRGSLQSVSYALGGVGVAAIGLFQVSLHGIEQPAIAASAHAVVALGLLISNYRWERRALALVGLYLILTATLWALWWQAPGQTALGGFVLAVEAFVLALGALAMRGVRLRAHALLRRALRDATFAACLLAVVVAVTSGTLESNWHTGTLFTLAFTAFVLTRLTGEPTFTFLGSGVSLLGMVHLSLHTLDWKSDRLAIEVAILTHITLTTLAALAYRRQARVFGEPLKICAWLTSAVAVPLLFFPASGLAFAWAGFAVWLGVLWLAFALLWSEDSLPGFQGAFALAALLAAFGWIEQQEWWATTSLWLFDPRALQAFAVALLTHSTLATVMAILWGTPAWNFNYPLRWSARLSSMAVVPILFFPASGFALVSAGLAVWLGAVWLAFVLLWKEKWAFSAFQGAITLSAILVAFAWIEQQPWWASTSVWLGDPRALHAFGIALGSLAVVWVIARRAVHSRAGARALWCDNPVSVDRIVLGVLVLGCLLLAVIAVVPGVRAEFTPVGLPPPIVPPLELSHAWDATVWAVLGLLAGAGLLSWRLSKLETDTDAHTIALALLFLSAAVVWAGSHGVDVATASALRWGLGIAFLIGSVAIALRVPLIRGAEALGFVVKPSPALRNWQLALFAVAAGVVVLLSATVAEIGLNRIKPSGPGAESVFAEMGAIASNLIPLCFVILGLSTTAARERSSSYALVGGLVFMATLTAGYALAVITAGKPLDGSEQVRLVLVLSGAAAVWSLLWLASEWRVPGGQGLTVPVLIGFVALGLLCLIPAMRLLASPGTTLPNAFDQLAQFGWVTLAAVVTAGLWHPRRVLPDAKPVVYCFVGLVVGVLVAAGVRAWDKPDLWVTFHALALTWAAVGFAFFAAMYRSAPVQWIVAVFAGLLAICALRAGWEDPWKPWFSAGLLLVSAVFFGGLAVRIRTPGLALASGAMVTLSAIIVWVAWGPKTISGFALATAIGLSAATACWVLVRLWQDARGEDAWLQFAEMGCIPAFGLLAIGLIPPILAGEHPDSSALMWSATAAVALAFAGGLWDRATHLARPGLYTTGVLAVLLCVAEITLKPVWNASIASVALAAYVLGVSALALVVSRSTKPIFRMPERGGQFAWLFGAQGLVAFGVIVLGLRMGLIAPELWERFANPAGIALLALSAAVMLQSMPEALRGTLRSVTLMLGVFTFVALAWSGPEPADRHAWLHRNGWLFVALAFTALVGSATALRLSENWRVPMRGVVGWAAVSAFVVLCVNLLQQVPVYDPNPEVRRTPLSRLEALTMLAGIGGLIVLALRFALKEEHDPFELRPTRRTIYVYTAEVLIVLFFLQVRYNVPELCRKELAKLWTFIVMALAYIGIGLAEFFERRRKIPVLAIPLRRTGVLLPLVPLLAFWIKPPVFVSEFAREQAPGLGPLLGYLERLPQHFDTYAWLWVLAGGVYGLVALSRKSFGWALLAALATNAALWSLLTHHEVPFAVHPQAWVIPLALIVLVSEHVNRRRLTPEVSNAMRYAGISMIYVASAADMFLAGVGQSVWLPVVLAVLCVLGVLLGILLRVRAFIYLGVGFLLLDIFSMIWHAAVNLEQTWVWYASGIVLGVAVLALFAYLEKRRTHAKESP